jgi:hypothetical protein
MKTTGIDRGHCIKTKGSLDRKKRKKRKNSLASFSSLGFIHPGGASSQIARALLTSSGDRAG